ncbi:MAG: glycosyltransferase family 4 protein [Ruminococcus sp.]|nr:glycosyltransferase family 4 protein [Ruminococcus sp.]
MNKRKIWLVRTGEILPIDEESPRLFRMGLIGQICASNPDNEVVWWCSTLNHFKKEFRRERDCKKKIAPNYDLFMIHGPGYSKNMSVRRLYHQFYEGKHFMALAEREEQPDVILCSMPTPELAYYVSKYAKKHNIPVFADIRDTFPDMYVDFCSDRLRPFMKVGIIPYKIMLSKALKRCTGIIATSEKFLDWGLNYAKRGIKDTDRAYYVSYPDNNVELTDADRKFWYDMGIEKDDFVCCFFGQFGFTVDLETVMKAAVITAKKNPKVKYVICGVGEKLSEYKEIVKGCDNVIFPGWVDRVQICSLGEISSAGLLSYRPGKNYENSMPNKFCEYLALKLALLIQPEGMMLDFAEKYQCGVHYSNEEQLAEQILMLADNREKTASMKENARNLYEEKFCAEKVYADMVKFLEDNSLKNNI